MVLLVWWEGIQDCHGKPDTMGSSCYAAPRCTTMTDRCSSLGTKVGLDNAGKTTILYKLHLGEVVVSQATVGSNVELVKYRNLQLEVRTGRCPV